MTMTRKLTKDEINNILDKVYTSNTLLYHKISQSTNKILKSQTRKQLEQIQIYPKLIPEFTENYKDIMKQQKLVLVNV